MGGTSSRTGLSPRNAANRLPIGGSDDIRRATPAGTPSRTKPSKRWLGSEAARPMVITVKNTPIERTWAEFWKVFIMPAPAPRWSKGSEFITPARFGEAKRPIDMPITTSTSANQT